MKYRILMVEDEPDISKALCKRLAGAGYEVRMAADALIGLKEAHDFKPSLIILDLKIPAGGGLGVLEKLSLSTNTSHIPVVVLTGIQDEAYKRKVLDAGVTAYFTKPYDHEKLLSEIRTIIGAEETST